MSKPDARELTRRTSCGSTCVPDRLRDDLLEVADDVEEPANHRCSAGFTRLAETSRFL